MQYPVYSNSIKKSEKETRKVSFEKGNLSLPIKGHTFPKFTKHGRLELAQEVVTLPLYRKINNLYLSITEARNVLLKHKSVLSTVENVEHNCITPLAESNKMPMVFYKREDLTSIKAYKVRGALFQMSKILEENSCEATHFIAASTGNHALGVLKAADILKISKVTICISECVTEFKREKLGKKIADLNKKGINAQLIVKGQTFDETNKIAQEIAQKDECGFYIDPYNTHNAVAGQGTIGLELLSQLENKLYDFENPNFNITKFSRLKEITVIVPIGGGGLISGIACALKTGIANFSRLKKFKLNIIGVKLADLNSKYGDAIKVEATGEHNEEYIRHFVDQQITISDADMKNGIKYVYEDLKTKVEGASAGTLKPILEKMVVPSETNAVICILSGSNIVLN